ncbi:MAG: hypothetical protein A2Y33_03910 [Spirochaetes bacterium GWF1_51_8]|nr:MAG: hypothetical protein A2Y33_03910 [Spirochaetes bacterium GWF1_51_8]
MTRAFWLLVCLTFALVSCGERGWVKPQDGGTVSFSFYFFVQIGGEKHSANGDAVLIKNTLFKFRIYDNIAGQYLMGFLSHTNGLNEMVLPMDKTIVKKMDAELSAILTSRLYDFFIPVSLGDITNKKTVDFSIESNKIKYLIIPYGSTKLKIEVLKTTPEGQPARLKIENEKNWMVFDILEYRMADFVLDTSGFGEYWTESPKLFLEWIGEIYGGG